MNDRQDRCRAVCWIIGAVVAVVAYVLFRPGLAVLLAFLLALILGGVVAWLLMRFVCTASEAEVAAAQADTDTRSAEAVAAPPAAPQPTAVPGAIIANAAGGHIAAASATRNYPKHERASPSAKGAEGRANPSGRKSSQKKSAWAFSGEIRIGLSRQTADSSGRGESRDDDDETRE